MIPLLNVSQYFTDGHVCMLYLLKAQWWNVCVVCFMQCLIVWYRCTARLFSQLGGVYRGVLSVCTAITTDNYVWCLKIWLIKLTAEYGNPSW